MPGLDSLATQTISRRALTPAELAPEVELLGPRWSIDDHELRLDLLGGMRRIGEVAAYAGLLAEELGHHPRVVLEYGTLILTLRTQDTDAITIADLIYAARLEQYLREHGWD
jgi:hypothetical protein